MPDPLFEVYPYTIEKLKQLLADKSSIESEATLDKHEVISDKFHTDYFEGYFSHPSISAQTIVVENCYVDHDYLEDYAHYYVRCFHPYKRTCVRLHFFQTAFDEVVFESLLAGSDQATITKEQLQHAYLGFVVVKPLPETIIGRTCLATYDTDSDRRQYPITRKYTANLFGIKLTVESLAFQEQDSVVAVCATSALWTVFQGTGMLFHHAIFSPVEITKAATKRLTPETRTLTKTGLNPEQLCEAVRKVGLEPYVIRASNSLIVAVNVYAYLMAKIPMILGVTLVDTSVDSNSGVDTNVIGEHAVAVTGFSLGQGKATPIRLEDGGREFLLRATKINKLYVHDDGIGPFARMEMDDIPVELIRAGQASPKRESFSSSWRGEDKQIGSVRAAPVLLLVPLYHKIRIPFDAILTTMYRFDGFIETLRESANLPLESQLEWDIHLTTVNDLKSEIIESPELSEESRKRVLLTPMPKYLWRGLARCEGRPVLGLVLDATDIEQGQTFVCAIEFDPVIASILREVTKEKAALSDYQNQPEWKIITWYANQSAQDGF